MFQENKTTRNKTGPNALRPHGSSFPRTHQLRYIEYHRGNMLGINNSGKSNGNYHTKCHNGTLLPFRARCNKVCLAKHHTLIIKHCNIRTLNAQWRRTSSGVTGTRSPRSLQSTAMRTSKSRTTLTI